jgi:hypothetical protein
LPNLDAEQREQLTAEHFGALRSVPVFASSRIYVNIENNLGMSGSDIARDIRNSLIPNVQVLFEKKNLARNRPGFVTTDLLKEDCERAAKLALDQGRVVFAAQCVSGNPFIPVVDNRLVFTRNKFRTQLLSMRHLINVPVKSTGSFRTVISGKFDSSGNYASTQDDLALTFMFAVYWYEMLEKFTTMASAIDTAQTLALPTLQRHRPAKRKAAGIGLLNS